MASAVTGKCFTIPNKCYNCIRKCCDMYAETSEAKYRSTSDSCSDTDEKINGENAKGKADDKHETKFKSACGNEAGNTESKLKSKRSSQQETPMEKCQVDDKLGKKDLKNRPKKGDTTDTRKVTFKSENSNGKEDNGNTKGGKTDNYKKEKMNSKIESKNNKEKNVKSKVLKRCTGCFLMTYCDETCQKEHWSRVHKYHCAYLSGKKVSSEHKENSCVDCTANENVSKDELYDINSPKIGCRIKEESNRMRRELGMVFGFHSDGYSCTCGNQFACEHPFPIGKIQGLAVTTGIDEMTVHAAKLCNAFIIKGIKANVKKDVIDRLFTLHKGILHFRVELWCQILVYGDIPSGMALSLVDISNFQRDVRDKVEIENPWFKSLDFSLDCILGMVRSREAIQLDVSEIKDPKLIGKYNYHQSNVKNVSMITKNNLWHRIKLWPSKISNSLVLSLPKDVFCISCNADLSGQVVGLFSAWDPSNPSPSLLGEVSNSEGVIAICSPVRNFDCIKLFCIERKALKFTDEDNQGHKTLLEKTRVCHMCRKWSSSSHRCTECYAAQYCSKDCQEKDWKEFHQTVCSTWAKDPARKLMSSKKQKQVSKGLVCKVNGKC